MDREALSFKRRQSQAAGTQAMGLITGAIGVLDRFGRRVGAGDLVMFSPDQDLLFQVEAITPCLDKQAPPGLVTMSMVCRFPLHAMSNQPMVNLVFIDRTRQSEGGAPGDAGGGTGNGGEGEPLDPEPGTQDPDPGPGPQAASEIKE